MLVVLLVLELYVDVEAAPQVVASAGTLDAGLDVDGIYGNLTNGAVINISKGAKGNITKTLQGLLICNGYGTNGFDGIFGNGTDSAVREYQSDNGLYVDGIAGKNTFSKLCR